MEVTSKSKVKVPKTKRELQVCIDRDKENQLVVEFQKTGDVKILEEVYKNRIPTLKGWANKHYFPGLTFSVDDLFEDLSVVFVHAAEKYKKEKGTFNTCLYTFIENRLKNIKMSRYAKKRLPEEYEGSAIGMVLSLDYAYNSDDGTEVTLKDVLPSSAPADKDYVLENTYMEETLNILSRNDKKFKEFLVKIGEGNSLVSLIKEYKNRQGVVKVSSDQAQRFSKRKCPKMVKDLLKKEVSLEGEFKLLGYTVEGNGNLKYEVELKKTKETDKIMKSLRELRQNKEIYKKKLDEVI